MLTAIRLKEEDEIRFSCGCFFGSRADLETYIANGKACFRKTRTLAMNTALELIDAKNDE